MHSTIERQLHHCDVFLPYDYVVIMQTARKTPFPYFVKEIAYTEPMCLTSDYMKSIRPGKRTRDPLVSDVFAYHYNGRDSPAIYFKTRWDQEWTVMPTRISSDLKEWSALFPRQPTIKDRKFRDLIAMKCIMPRSAQLFYESLPHE